MASIERIAYPRLRSRLSEDERNARYTLSGEERDFVRSNARGAGQRLTLALMLKTFRHLGYISDLSEVPEPVRDFVGQQFDLPPGTPTLDGPKRKLTRFRYRQSVLALLGWTVHSEGAAQQLRAVLETAARTMSDPADLINVAGEDLVKSHIELDDLSERFQGPVESVLFGVRVQSPEGFRGGHFLELDRDDQAQDVVPVPLDQVDIDVAYRLDLPLRTVDCTASVEQVELLAFEVLDAGRVGESEQMSRAEDHLAVTMCIGRMDITLDDIVVHEPIDHIGTFTLAGAEHGGMKEEVAFIDEAVDRDPLFLAEVLERVVGPMSTKLSPAAILAPRALAFTCSRAVAAVLMRIIRMRPQAAARGR
jgi:hypothetical protein